MEGGETSLCLGATFYFWLSSRFGFFLMRSADNVQHLVPPYFVALLASVFHRYKMDILDRILVPALAGFG